MSGKNVFVSTSQGEILVLNLEKFEEGLVFLEIYKFSKA